MKQPKTYIVSLRLTQDERDMLVYQADTIGISLPEVMRLHLRGESGKVTALINAVIAYHREKRA